MSDKKRPFDPKNPTHRKVLDLIQRGLVEYTIEDGEVMLSLTTAGINYCEMKLLGD